MRIIASVNNRHKDIAFQIAESDRFRVAMYDWKACRLPSGERMVRLVTLSKKKKNAFTCPKICRNNTTPFHRPDIDSSGH